ncbi:MAG: ABC transporter permease [Alphaproteobacteria bacterium]|nr:ABC transporter permease [Alphaproteobacteria bacterium]
MWLSYLKIGVRNLLKNRLYAAINVIGLGLGLTIYLMSNLVADYERDHDHMFANRDRIFTVSTVYAPGSNSSTVETRGVYTAMKPLIELAVPELTGIARAIRQEVLATAGEKTFYQEVRFVDPDFVQMFDFDYIAGDAMSLGGPNEIAISDDMARKFFGSADVVGETITFEHREDLRIKAVYRAVPEDSHFNSTIGESEGLEAFVLMPMFERLNPDYELPNNWFNLSSDNLLYLMTDGNLSQVELESRVDQVYRANAPEDAQESNVGQHVRPLSEANLSFWYGVGVPFITIVEVMGLLVLAIAMINYTNLATAQYMGRTREVGLRKTLGATRGQLLSQFLVESLCTALVAMLIALVALELVVPAFNQAFGKVLALHYGAMIPWVLAVTVVVGLLAGAYPAYMIVRAEPVEALKADAVRGNKGGVARSIMIGTQFALSIILLAMVLVIFGQNQRMLSASDIFPKSQIMDVRRVGNDDVAARGETLLREIRAIDGVESASFSSQIPFLQQNWRWDVTSAKGDVANKFEVNTINVDYDFFSTYDIPIIAGRGFSREISADLAKRGTGFSHVVINELASRRLGYDRPEDAVGQIFYDASTQDNPYQAIIVGVMADRNILGLHNQMRPFVARVFERYRHLSVRVGGDKLMHTIEEIENAWARVVPEYPMDWSFLDAVFDGQFMILRAVNEIIAGFAVVAILLAMFGLFGLAAFMAERRTKEIGIRKVLGADIARIVGMLVFQFSKPVFWALLLAVPTAYLLAEEYLSLFSDRIGASLVLILTAGVLALVFSWATISLHAVRVARQNPIKALRYE